MNVGQLRAAIANLSDNMPVIIPRQDMGTEDDFDLVIVPASRDRWGYVSEGHVGWDGYTNIQALFIGGYPPDGEDITPQQPPRVIDAELAQPELGSGDQQ